MTASLTAVAQGIFTYAHPVIMWVLWFLCLYSLYLGMGIRKTRAAKGEARRKLIQQRFHVQHHQVGALLLSLLVVGSISGIGVTYVNNGKLFVGPHLIVGLGMTALVAIVASLTPWMQSGKAIIARNVHLALGVLILGLFTWEAITGMEIVQKIMAQT